MAYKALYRTYRPQDFNEVAGQEHITTTFKNALKDNKIAHAFLFSGPRGTGKTSIAKIIAKAVNCENAPTDNPCNKCDNCLGITNNSISDVIEVDAASNNGVDEIREITDKVKFMPTQCKYKVYIIDEVHMLSTSAFNAILKTLEEPPAHVIFILATTEPHKVLSTIHSRCQRFDFRGITKQEMVNRMNTVLETEGLSVNDEALNIIAEVAEGGMRDALSLLDQVITFSENEVTVEDVNTVTGTVSNEEILKIANLVIENDSLGAIEVYENMLKQGKETPRVLSNMITFYRDLLMYKTLGDKKKDKVIYSKENFQELSKKITHQQIYDVVDKLSEAQDLMKKTVDKKVIMEVTLIKLLDNKEVTSNNQVTNTNIDNLVDNKRFIKVENDLNEMIDSIKLLINNEVKETKTYDIKVIEEILNKAFEDPLDSKEKMELLKDNWKKIANQTDINLSETAKLMIDLEIKAYSNNNGTRGIVLTNDKVSICNKIMELKSEVKEILSNTFRANYNFIVIPNEVWNEKRKEFVVQKREGVEKPRLSAIKYNGLVDRQEFDLIDETEAIKLAKRIFSSKLLEIK